jgi:hypothetical protein
LKQSDMTIHWKALEEHFLTVPLVSWFNHLQVENAFSENAFPSLFCLDGVKMQSIILKMF